ncbi:hypothetical protein J4E08_16670 [Sagittula sp. NFXS13]|uniref:hypothetical protein n=1 Tax=Sagittula sp. NFXS13 TaxID=2819095 RepID=UPI0032DEA8D3
MPRALLHNRNMETPPSEAEIDSGLNILLIAALPLVAWLFEGTFSDVATAFMQLWLLCVAIRLIATGQRRHYAYTNTPGARAPRIPRKILGEVLLGLLVTLLAGHHFDSILVPLIIGGMAVGLGNAAFGTDPLRDKIPLATASPDTGLQAQIATERTEHALTQIADRIAMLEDAELTRRTEAARHLVMRLLRSFTRDPESVLRLQRPMDKFISLLDAESNRLCMGNARESSAFARRRYIAKLEVMTESFETSARKIRVRGDKDAFEVEADILLNRMPSNTPA